MPAVVPAPDPQGEETAEAGHVVQGGGDGHG